MVTPMRPSNLRCQRCGYTPMGPTAAHLRPGSPCPQCSAPMGWAERVATTSARDAARPIGREDRDRAKAEAAQRSAKKPGGPLAKLVPIVIWILIVGAMTGNSPGKLLRLAQSKIEAALHGGGGRTPGAGDADSFAPPDGFEQLHGTWMGSPINALAQHWTFRFGPGTRVHVTEADGAEWDGEARVYWERGAGGGLRVLDGGFPLDLALDRRGGGPPAILLGSYRIDGSDSIRLCLGRPDGLERTSEFRSTKRITCWSLTRTGGP
jgi:hypothetical protein